MADPQACEEFEQGWFSHAKRCESPNYNQRPKDAEISLLVIHNISLPPKQYGESYIEDFFCNRLDVAKHPYFETIQDLQVSAHFLIKRDGELVQFVSCDERAWHAGASQWQNRENCNDFSVGIELEGCDDEAFEQSQYQTLLSLSEKLMLQYPALSETAIAGHSDIAPGRKTDPGPYFDWDSFRQQLAQRLAATAKIAKD